MTTAAKDTWSSAQYLKYIAPRTRPAQHLVTSLPFTAANPPQRIVDLGCGPGNSTKVLRDQFPDAQIWGVDSSESMIQAARKSFGSEHTNGNQSPNRKENPTGKGTVQFEVGDINTWVAPPPSTSSPSSPNTTSSKRIPATPDLYFANAVFQWFPHAERISLIHRLLQPAPNSNSTAPPPTLAFQLPHNLSEPSHHLMRSVASSPGPWQEYFATHTFSEQMYPVPEPEEWYDDLSPFCANVEVWKTTYYHVMEKGVEEVVEWVKGTGLRPFLEALPEDGGVREAFLREYLRRLSGEEGYKLQADGRTVLLRYPRLFGVVVGKRGG